MAGLRRCSKALPKAKLAPKKVHGHCLVACCPSGPLFCFLNHSKIITSEMYAQQINEMHLQCLKPALVNRKGPILLHDNAQLHVTQLMLQGLNEVVYEVLPHPLCSPDPLPTNYHFFKQLNNFLQENTPTTNRKQKMLSKSLLNLKAWIFTLQE